MEKQANQQDSSQSFEQSMDELEGIVEAMEDGKMPLEEMVQRFERGTRLVEACRKMLEDAERKIKILENGKLKDYKPEAQRGD